jgi:hypothetical protein
LLTFFGWLFAIGHVAFEHHGITAVGAWHHEVEGGTGHHDGLPEHDSDHHEHDLMAFASGQFAKTAELKALAPAWLPLFDSLVARLAEVLRAADNARAVEGHEMSPPDERASGWLLVVQTALPVRGPSLVA